MSIRCAVGAVRPSLVCLAVAFPLALAGCGKTTATVSGVVKYQGEPLPSGTVIIYGANSNDTPARGAIGENGKYIVTDAPLGEVKIAIQVQDIGASPTGGPGRGGPNPGMMGRGAPGGQGDNDPAKGAPGGGGDDMANGVPGQSEHMKPMPGGERRVVQIPKQYMSPDTSGKTARLKKGKNLVNIDLE
jgi:hypothetical protein